MPSQPSVRPDGAPGVVQPVEMTMPKRDPTADAEIRELLRETVGAVFPGQLWEALLARLERQEGRA